MNTPDTIISPLKNKKIAILGLGREGLSTYRFLRQELPTQKLALLDQKATQDLDTAFKQIIKKDQHLKINAGSSYIDNLQHFDIIFKTPGIPLSTNHIQAAMKKGVKISSNLQLFFDIIEAFKQENKDKVIKITDHSSQIRQPITIGVTGTKGKSTTAAVIHHVLAHNGLQTLLIGNIGQPALDLVSKIRSKTKLVIELSSHQLDQLQTSPDIAVVQEVTSEHLDYYPDTQAYIDSKKSITRYQKVNQYVIYDPQWQKTQEIANLSRGRHLHFNLNKTSNNDILVYIKDGYLTFRDSNKSYQIIAVNDIPLLGKHNVNNVAPAIIVARMLNIKTDRIRQALTTFQPLPHRLEKVAIKDKTLYVNDSLSTTPDAAISALSCFADQPIILLAGGHERQQDFSPLAEKIIDSKVKALVLFTTNGPRLWQAIKDKQQELGSNRELPHKVVSSMPEAMQFVKQYQQPGDVVLLSPAAASFGLFKNYADRGNQFKNWLNLS